MKFDEIKKMSAWELLKLLQNKTRNNTALIKENGNLIQSVLKGETQLANGRFNVAEIQAKNSELIKENSEYLRLHNQLLNFMKGVCAEEEKTNAMELEVAVEKNNTKKEKGSIFTVDEYFDQTISGLIEYNKRHPYFNSEDFRNRLINYYTQIEAYEKCAFLVNQTK